MLLSIAANFQFSSNFFISRVVYIIFETNNKYLISSRMIITNDKYYIQGLYH